jgi:hypothetical protein
LTSLLKPVRGKNEFQINEYLVHFPARCWLEIEMPASAHDGSTCFRSVVLTVALWYGLPPAPESLALPVVVTCVIKYKGFYPAHVVARSRFVTAIVSQVLPTVENFLHLGDS